MAAWRRGKVVMGPGTGLRGRGLDSLLLLFNGREGGAESRARTGAEFPGAGGPGLRSLDTSETRCEH